ncbi:ABC transporter ATP-binding protein [Xylanivirga thermophila]|uniref:ABC transporter ATP-binding protein n=1 Tax=Xylanivirga thermophila TaxID=2496273 RepID=UPI00101CE8AB|nr:ABC transporter ATP-binding protein [Xylanivirga thermophila]
MGNHTEAKKESKKARKKKDKNLIKRLMIYAKPYWYYFLIAIILILAISASGLARPYIIKKAIDDNITKAYNNTISPAQAKDGIKNLGILFFVLISSEFIFGYIQTYTLQSTGKKIIMNLRNDVFSHLQHLPVSYFDKNPVGRIVTTVMNDTEALNEMYTEILVGFFQNIFLMIGIIIIMFKLNSNMTILSLSLLPIIAFVTVLFRKKARQIFTDIRSKLGRLNAFMSEHISGMKIIQTFNMQDKKYKEFEAINKEYYNGRFRQIKLFGILRPLMDIVRSLSLAILIWYGGKNIIQNSLEFGTLYAFTNYINLFFHPIMYFAEGYNTIQSAIVSGNRIFNLLDEEPEPQPEVNDKISVSKLRGEIEFKNVWFAYEDQEWVLKDVSFKIEPGESVAFVGATGAGKTSIINLICGFYENQRGNILIDGVNIKNMDKKQLRKNIGIVLQDVFLFSGDIETNIRLFNKDITTQEVIEAARYANADHFINTLSQKYKHPVHEKGSTLSMGQRQLLSFARALVIDPKILVMDEATSNIDTETEILIQQALANLMKGRTTIAIAHRLSTIQNADKIIVIHKGRIREMGNHSELLKIRGLYYNLYMLQYKDYLVS